MGNCHNCSTWREREKKTLDDTNCDKKHTSSEFDVAAFQTFLIRTSCCGLRTDVTLKRKVNHSNYMTQETLLVHHTVVG